MGNRWNIKTTLLADVSVGTLVLIHAGFAIATIDEEEAQKTWQLIAELDEFENERKKHC
jgi:hydrogenase expression/formation protein HypC